MPNKLESISERFSKAREEYFTRSAMVLEHASLAQAELISLTTDTMTRGYLGILNGTTGAIMQGCVGFLEGLSRAYDYDQSPMKTAQKKSSRRGGGKKKS
jgi:hypothetical protein